MITELSYENLRGLSRTLPLSRRVHISGPNGVGKSSIADAIAYAYTGKDACGKPMPIWIITEGKDKMIIRLKTEKSIIERTLQSNKYASIRLTIGDNPSSIITQEYLTQKTCKPDSFLSAFNVGYFMSLTNEKKMEVLRDIIPPVDKMALLEQLLGFTIEESVKIMINIDKRADLAIKTLSEKRRETDKTIAWNKGKLDSLMAIPEPGEKKEDPAPVDIFEKAEAWETYKNILRKYEKAVQYNEEVTNEKKTIEENVSLVEASLKGLTVAEKPTDVNVVDLESQIKNLEKQRRAVPNAPDLRTDLDMPQCPTCGQTVGTKHRAATEKAVKEKEDKYKKDLETVTAFNSNIDTSISKLKEELSKAKEQLFNDLEKYHKYEAEKATYLNKIKVLKSSARLLAAVPLLPEKPPFPEVTKEAFTSVTEEYNRKKQEYLKWVDNSNSYQKARQEIKAVEAALSQLSQYVSTLKNIEETIPRIDEEMFKITEKCYTLSDGYKLVIVDGDVTVRDSRGELYVSMSTGERIRAGARISEKIANSLPNKVPFMFIDNYDLCSEDLTKLKVSQIFTVTVDPNLPDIFVKI